MNGREQAWCLLTEFTQSESLRKHGLAVEACMRAYARKLASDSPEKEELWGVVGLLHDFDYEKFPSLDDHSYKGNEILKERGYSDEIRRAINVARRIFWRDPGLSHGESPLRVRRTGGIHHRLRPGQAGKVSGGSRGQVRPKEDERQSLRPQRKARRHRKRRGGLRGGPVRSTSHFASKR